MKNSFTLSERKKLSEIYRRLNYFHNGNLDSLYQFLGVPSSAKKLVDMGIIIPSYMVAPCSLNWYSLTEKGKLFFKHYITNEKLDENTNTLLFDGNLFIEFDYSIYKRIFNE